MMSSAVVDYAGKFYGLEGGEISSEDWKKLFRMKKRFVKMEKVLGFEVETIWEGRGILLKMDGENPLVYQTMVYFGGTRVEVGHWYWKNRKDAVEGHDRIVEALRSGSYGADSTDLETAIS